MGTLRLLRNTKTGAAVDFIEALLDNPDFVEMTPQEVSDFRASLGQTNAKPADLAVDGLVFHMAANGIGDAVSGLYAACGYASAGRRVTYHTRFADLLAPLVEHENLTIRPGRGGIDCNADYSEHLKQARETGVTRAQWYAGVVARAYGIEAAPPARPKVIRRPPSADGSCVVLAPFAAHSCREWHVGNWTRLAKMLREDGHKVIVVGGQHDGDRCRETFGMIGIECRVGRPLSQLAALLAGASLVIGNESGIAHLAGLLEVQTLAILGITTHRWTYDMAPSVTSVAPDASVKCAGCFWQAEGGTLPVCSKHCGALQTVSVFQVRERAIECLGAKRAQLRLRPKAERTKESQK